MDTLWQAQLNDSFTDTTAFLVYLDLNPEHFGDLRGAHESFPFKVTKPYADRIQKGNSEDPLLLQVLPLALELELREGFSKDPVGDLLSLASRSILQKYHARALLISTGACAIHCRYCFRREFPYSEVALTKSIESAALEEIRNNASIEEVILSGGDPLSLSDERLRRLLNEISDISKITRIRIHTRLPIVLPNRITDALIETLGSLRPRVVMVIHSNHAQELDQHVQAALQKLSLIGITLLNQSVLLKSINDNATALSELSERLFECHTLPYYLHMLDKVEGSHHFDVEEQEAQALMEALRNRLPGYLVPKLVREIAGEPSKTPIA